LGLDHNFGHFFISGIYFALLNLKIWLACDFDYSGSMGATMQEHAVWAHSHFPSSSDNLLISLSHHPLIQNEIS